MPAALRRIVGPGGLDVRFQPIFEMGVDGPRVHYFEGLVRGPAGSNFERAEVLFEYVRLLHAEAEVDRACATTILAAARRLPGHPRVGLNVHAATLARDPEFVAFLGRQLAEQGMAPERLIVEVVEHRPPLDERRLGAALDALRTLGAWIALDDVGAGHSSYRMMLDILPEYLKVDRCIVQGCSTDFRRRAVLESMFVLCERFPARVVAEGVETCEDLLAVRDLGVDLVQGYLLARPLEAGCLTREGAERPRPGRWPAGTPARETPALERRA